MTPPGSQQQEYHESVEGYNAALQRTAKNRQLEAFVRFCQDPEREDDPDCEWESLTLSRFPTKYTYQSKECVWTARMRQGDKTLGRLLPVSPSNKEGYFLRILLCTLTRRDVATSVPTVNKAWRR